MRIISLMALLVAAGCASPSPPGAVTRADRGGAPRVFLIPAQQLQAARQRLRQGDAALAPALARLEREAQTALGRQPYSVVYKNVTPPSGDKHDYMSLAPYFWPNPDTTNGLPYIRRDGERNPEIYRIPDHRSLAGMADSVETLALAYYFTGKKAYATKAVQFIRVWFLDPATRMNPNLQFGQGIPGINTGRGIGIIETRELTQVVDAAGLLAGAGAWTAGDRRGLDAWFGEYLRWLMESDHGRTEASWKNNHGTYYDVQVVTFAFFLGRRELADRVLQTVGTKRIAVQIEPDGRQPLELERTKAWTYSIGNLRGLMLLAHLGRQVGVDLWNFQTADGRSIRKALDFLLPFACGEKPWPYLQIDGWQAQAITPVLAVAATEYPDPKYREALAKLPPAPAGRGILLNPDVLGPK